MPGIVHFTAFRLLKTKQYESILKVFKDNNAILLAAIINPNAPTVLP